MNPFKKRQFRDSTNFRRFRSILEALDVRHQTNYYITDKGNFVGQIEYLDKNFKENLKAVGLVVCK